MRLRQKDCKSEFTLSNLVRQCLNGEKKCVGGGGVTGEDASAGKPWVQFLVLPKGRRGNSTRKKKKRKEVNRQYLNGQKKPKNQER